MKANTIPVSKIVLVLFLVAINFACKSQDVIKQKETLAFYKSLDIMVNYVKNEKFIQIKPYKKCSNVVSFLLSDALMFDIDEDKFDYKIYEYKNIPVTYMVSKKEKDDTENLLDSYLKKSAKDIYKVYYTYRLPKGIYTAVINEFTIFYIDSKFYFRTEIPADMIEKCNL